MSAFAASLSGTTRPVHCLCEPLRVRGVPIEREGLELFEDDSMGAVECVGLCSAADEPDRLRRALREVLRCNCAGSSGAQCGQQGAIHDRQRERVGRVVEHVDRHHGRQPVALGISSMDVHPLDSRGFTEARRHCAKVPVVVRDRQVDFRWHRRFAPAECGESRFHGCHGKFHRRDGFDVRPRQQERFHESTLPSNPIQRLAAWV